MKSSNLSPEDKKARREHIMWKREVTRNKWAKTTSRVEPLRYPRQSDRQAKRYSNG